MTLLGLEQLFAALPGPYVLRIGRDYTPKMDELYLTAFPEAEHLTTDEDICDARAWHLTVNHTSQLAGYGRPIPGPDGCLAG